MKACATASALLRLQMGGIPMPAQTRSMRPHEHIRCWKPAILFSPGCS
jgi:hypothetical protein